MYSLRVLGGVTLEGPTGPVSGRAAQRRELALLAVLATASGQGVTRDKLIGCLWPDSGDATARRTLANAIYVLRNELGENIILSTGDVVRLNPEIVRTDVEDFLKAHSRGDLEGAVAAYNGPLLDGFHAGAGHAFESWLHSERQRLALLYGEALESLAERSEAANDQVRAATWWQRLVASDPHNSRAVLRMMQALTAAGDVANALKAAAEHERLLRDELELEPSPEVLELARQLRDEQGAAGDARLAVDVPVWARRSAFLRTAWLLPNRPRRSLTARNVALAVVAAAVLAGGIAVGRFLLRERGVELGSDGIPIVVLPFENQSPDPGDAYFAEGVYAQIHTLLAKIASLKVISRKSSMVFGGQPSLVQEIADTLGVSYVLEGTAYREDDRARITVNLIDARTDESIWAEVFERDAGDVLALQAEIALQVAEALHAILTPDEIVRIERRPTENAQAYELFAHADAIRFRTQPERLLALELYSQAVELDPEFAEAWAQIASQSLHLMFYGDPIPLTRVDSALARAIELGPDLVPTHLAQGWYVYTAELDHEHAVEHFEAAKRLEPSNINAIESVGYIRLFQGRWEEGVAVLEEVVELDPLNPESMWPLAGTYLRMRRYDEAIQYYERALWRDPLYVGAYMAMARTHIMRDGNVESARRVLERAEENAGPNRLVGMGGGGTSSPLPNTGRILIDWYEEALRDSSVRAYSREHNPGLYLAVQAELAALSNLPDRAQAYADSLVAHYEALAASPDEYGRAGNLLRLRLAWSLARAGRGEEGIRLAERAAEEVPLSRDAWLGANLLSTLAEVYVLAGDYEQALDQVEVLLSVPSDLSVGLLKLDPLWDPLRDHPRFQALLEEYE
jgi:serine/threonine-protein kinase